MSNISKELKATIVIDLRWGIFRIYKNTLHILNDPNYIQFMVNPDTKTLAIRPATSRGVLAERIRWNVINNNRCCELYSYTLTNHLANLYPEWDKNSAYKLEGKIFNQNNVISFNMADAVNFSE